MKNLEERILDQQKAYIKKQAAKGNESAIQDVVEGPALGLVFHLSDYNNPKYRGNKQKLADEIKCEVKRYKAFVSEIDPTGKYSQHILQYIKRSGF